MQRNTVVAGIVLSLLMISAVAVIADDTDAVPAPKVIYTEDDEAGTIVFMTDGLSQGTYRVFIENAAMSDARYHSLIQSGDTLTVSKPMFLGLEGTVEYKLVTYEGTTEVTVYEGSFTVADVTLHGNNGTTETETIVAGGAYVLPGCSFDAPEGKTFGGWSYTAGGDAIDADEIVIEGVTNLYAVWVDSGVDTVTVTVDGITEGQYKLTPGAVVEAGTEVTLTIVPGEGNVVKSVSFSPETVYEQDGNT